MFTSWSGKHMKDWFLLWHQVKYVLTELFCQDPLENWFGRQISLGSRKDNPSMADFPYNNAVTNQFKTIANSTVADSGMIALIDEPLPCWKPKKQKFNCKSWIKKLINSCFSQMKTKHKLTVYLMYLCHFFYLYKYLNRHWAN